MNDSYDSEGKFLICKEGEYPRKGNRPMPNGDSKITWDTLDKIAKIAVYPIIAALLFLLFQGFALDKRLAMMEMNISRPSTDIEMVRKIAIIEDRQNMVMKGLAENGQRIDRLSDLLSDEGGRVGGRRR
jgi:hypothetical protein